MAQPAVAVAVAQPMAISYGEKSSVNVSAKEIKLVAKPSTAAAVTASPAGNSLDGEAGVRVLQLHEYKQAAQTLAEAFKDDHVAWYFLETPDRAHWSKEQQWELHVQIFEYIVYAHMLKGIVVSAGPNYECIALWYV